MHTLSIQLVVGRLGRGGCKLQLQLYVATLYNVLGADLLQNQSSTEITYTSSLSIVPPLQALVKFAATLMIMCCQATDVNEEVVSGSDEDSDPCDLGYFEPADSDDSDTEPYSSDTGGPTSLTAGCVQVRKIYIDHPGRKGSRDHTRYMRFSSYMRNPSMIHARDTPPLKKKCENER